MLIYCDSVVLIYYLEATGSLHTRAVRRMKAIQTAADRVAISDLTRLECRVKPMRVGNAAALAIFDRFFQHPDLLRTPLTTAVFDRATSIRAHFKFGLADSLHLAAAVEAGCILFLTNDNRLSKFTGIAVEVLP